MLDWRSLRPGVDHLPYTISKAALAALTKSMAVAMAPQVTVKGIALGAILPPEDGTPLEKIIQPVPMKRWAQLEELDQTMLFLLDGPEYITGGSSTWMAAGTSFNFGEFMDQILIKDLLARGVIGISEKERSQPQDILINIVIFTDIRAAAISDDVEESINYRTVSKQVLAHASSVGRFTVEALAEDVARIILENPKVLGVRVRVEKPGAVRFTRSVGVEIERMRN